MENRYRVIQIKTPKKVLLDGLWLGGDLPETVFIFVHGLGSNAFSSHSLAKPLSNEKSAVLFFNNRGHDTVTRIKKEDKRKKRGATSFLGGMAHEVFTDCTDDIAGSVRYAQNQGAKNIILIGYSTGCQKSVYFLSKTKNPLIKAVVLLSPLSDYADFIKFTTHESYQKVLQQAQQYMTEGKPHQLLPYDVLPPQLPEPVDAQRFISLYTPDSPEEIFCYAQKDKKPTTLRKVKIPMLVILGEKDEYRDRPVKYIKQWFDKNHQSRNYNSMSIPKASHSFWGLEDIVIKSMKGFLTTIS